MKDQGSKGGGSHNPETGTFAISQYERYLSGEITYSQLHQTSPQALREEQKLVALSAHHSADPAKNK